MTKSALSAIETVLASPAFAKHKAEADILAWYRQRSAREPNLRSGQLPARLQEMAAWPKANGHIGNNHYSMGPGYLNVYSGPEHEKDVRKAVRAWIKAGHSLPPALQSAKAERGPK
jgi:hypothetical protein